MFLPATGRFILGSSAQHTYRTNGGAEEVVLERANLPSHSHDVTTYEWGHTVRGNGSRRRIDVDDGSPFNGIMGTLSTDEVGNGTPHENMPPFIALPLCIEEE